MKKYDVFISYSSYDQKIAEGICGYLEGNGYRCFVAYRDILPGVVWARAITEAMDSSAMMVVVFSEAFNGSEQTDREIEMASENKMPILPYRIASTDLTGAKKYYLKNINWIDAFPNPEGYFGKLLESVKRLVPKQQEEIDVPPEREIKTVKQDDGKDSNWKTACERWNKTGRWKMIVDGETICLHRQDNRNIHVQFGFWKGHYYIQAKYDPFSSFSQTLKWEYGGSRTYSTWWNHISTREYYDLKEGEFWQKFNESESMQNELVAWFNDLIAFIEKWDEPAERWFTLKKMIDVDEYRKQGWEFWVYHKKLANVCDSHLKDEGEPFIDTFSENGKIIIRLGNRTNKAERQKDILRKLNLPTDNVIEDDDRTDYAVFDEGTPNDVVMSKVVELMEKLSKK